MNADTPSRGIIAGSILTALALLFQSTQVWLPGLGPFLSLLATLPAALASVLSVPLGAVVYISAAFLLMLVDPQEAAVFLLGTGLLGLAIGIGRQKEHRVLIPAGALCIGMLALTDLALIPVFGGLTPRSVWVRLLVFPLFSLPYAALWEAVTRHVHSYLDRSPVFRDGG